MKASLVSKTPPETKVVAGGAAYVFLTAVVQLVQTYAPHVHLPSQSAMILIAGAISTIAGYLAPHTFRPDELVTEVTSLLNKAGGTVRTIGDAMNALHQPADQ